MKQYFVYILTNYNETVFYTGVTSNILKRIYEHKNKVSDSFTSEYNIVNLLYYEIHNDVRAVITREKTIKRWKREWKWNLIKSVNPNIIELTKDGMILPLPQL